VDSTLLKAGAADVIAFAFYQMGYRPRESLVLIGMRGPRRRLGLVVRVDLPQRRHLRAVLQQQLDAVARFGDDALLVLVVSDAQEPPGADGTVLPHRRLVRDLRRQVLGQGWSLQDVIGVGASRWRSYSCSDPSCCPAAGRPLEEVLASRVATFQIGDGRVLAADEAGLVADVAPRPSTADTAGTAGSRSPAAPLVDTSVDPEVDSSVGASPPGGLDAAAALRRWRALLETVPPAAGRAEAPAQLGWLIEALQDRWLRDAVLLTLVPGSGTAPEELLAGGDDSVLDGLLDQAPDTELLERGRVLLSAVARAAPPGSRVDALALLAWMSWWAGDGARARLLAGRALADQPAHRLARLVDSLLRVGVAPEWVQARRPVRVPPSR
jgi:hypothetical protein